VTNSVLYSDHLERSALACPKSPSLGISRSLIAIPFSICFPIQSLASGLGTTKFGGRDSFDEVDFRLVILFPLFSYLLRWGPTRLYPNWVGTRANWPYVRKFGIYTPSAPSSFDQSFAVACHISVLKTKTHSLCLKEWVLL